VPEVFETARLRLRPWRDTDAPGRGEGPDRDSLRFMPAGAQPGPDDFPAWLARRRREMDTGADLHWCIADADSDAMLGNVQVFRMGPVQDRYQGELGYWLRPGARGRGVLGEALQPVIAHAFTTVQNGGLGLTRLHAATDSDNDPSQAVLRSAGFTQWGADHQGWRRADGSLSDGRYFELLAVDLLPTGPLTGEPLTSGALASGPLADTDRQDTAVQATTLQGRGVHLRQWRHTDAERVVQACSDERTRHWIASLPSPYTLQDAHTYIAGRSEEASEGKGLYWCVADPDSDVCLGAVAVMSLDEALGTVGEIGYWAHRDARGRGAMTEAVRLAVRHAFIPRSDGGLGRQRLRLNAADGNSASAHVALGNGFLEVGRDRRAEPLGDGTFADLIRYDLLVDEFLG
jgi:RimJ/RimL family protein N-acetyltransferase